MRLHRTMKYLTIIFLLLTGTLAAEQRPNILWIFTDDHATQAIGAYGGRFEPLNLTPNLDRIAAEGILLSPAKQ